MTISSPGFTELNPYRLLGLSQNPFIAEQDSGVDALLWLDRGFSGAPHPGEKKFIQILGEKGAGKTSHLKHWQRQTGGAYDYYAPGWKRWRFPLIDEAETDNTLIAYWDEADRIPLPILGIALGWAAQRELTIVVGTHRDLGWVARVSGLSVITIQLPDLDIDTLFQWATLRIKRVQLPGEALGLQLTPLLASKIVTTAGASWRDAADQLHVWAAQRARTLVKY
jgi:hypothetical protein